MDGSTKTCENVANGFYAPAIALKLLGERFGITDDQLSREYRLSRKTLTRIRNGELLSMATYEYCLRQLGKALGRQWIAMRYECSDIETRVEIIGQMRNMFSAHFALLSDEAFMREEFFYSFL